MVAMTRPAIPHPAPAGYEWRAVAAVGWTTGASIVVGRRCRYGRPSHGVPAEAVLFRRTRTGRRIPWGYCADHLYGRWIDDAAPWTGIVLEWVLRERAA